MHPITKGSLEPKWKYIRHLRADQEFLRVDGYSGKTSGWPLLFHSMRAYAHGQLYSGGLIDGGDGILRQAFETVSKRLRSPFLLTQQGDRPAMGWMGGQPAIGQQVL
jgi:hypothetical protein